MKILQKHVTKEILAPFAIALLVMTFLGLLGDLFQEVADRFMTMGLALTDMGRIILYALPTLASYTIPIALLFATLFAFIRISHDCEIIALKAAGIPLRKVFAPAIAIGLIASVLLLGLRLEIGPWSLRQLKVFIIETVLHNPTLVLSEQAWTPEVNNMQIFTGDIDEETMQLRDISIMIGGEDEPDRVVVAEMGKLSVDTEQKKILLELDNGAIHEYDPEEPEKYSTTTFGSLSIPVNIESLDKYLNSSTRYKELGLFPKKYLSTKRLIQRLAEAGSDKEERRSLLGHISERIALAFMPLTFVLIGAPLGIIPYKTRRFRGLALCAGLLLTYYALLMLGEAVMKKDLVNPLLAMWIPNILLGTAGIVLMIRAERQ